VTLPGLPLEAKLIAYAVALVALIAGALALANHFEGLGRAAEKANEAIAQQAEHERIAKLNFRNNEVAGSLATKQADQKVIYATITKTVDRVVERPVYRSECIDDDGLRNINAALAGAAADPSQPDAAVPAAVAASGADGR
jgi:hypothetical protein